jgi:hypothetical protein
VSAPSSETQALVTALREVGLRHRQGRDDEEDCWSRLLAEIPAKQQSAWRRVDNEHPRWELPGERDSAGLLSSPGYLITDEAIRTFGRKHIECLLAGLPTLPEQAWEVDR